MERITSLISANTVMVFSKSYCVFCRKVKDLFTREKIPYHSIELDTMDKEGMLIQEALKTMTQLSTVPNVFIRGQHVGGCDATEVLYRTGTLQELVNGTYRQRDYDLIVIGGGSGGLAAAKEAASLNKRVAVCDYVTPTYKGTKWGLGGTCVNVGCIPKKLMHRSAILGGEIKDANHFGWEVPDNVNHRWEVLSEEVKRYIKSLNFGYRAELLKKKVKYFNAYASFIDDHTLTLTDHAKKTTTTVTADNFLIAVGGRPSYPDVPGAKEYGITSDDLFYLPHSPRKTLVVGGSYVALECAGFLRGLGLDVTVMYRSILLRGFDQQMANMIGDHMRSHGVKFIERTVPISVEEKKGEPFEYTVSMKQDEDHITSEEYNTVLFAVGRKACTSGIGLDNVGVSVHEGTGKIIVDEWERTSKRNIFAIGDVIHGKPELTPVAIQAGRLLVQRLYNKRDTVMDYDMIPTTVFTPLEYGCVGLSEEAAIDKYGGDDIEVYHTHFQPLEFTLPQRDPNKSYGKLICVKSQEERVVGLHILGPNAGEITQGFALALRMGATKKDFNDVVGIHPTCAEVFTTMFISKSSGISVDKASC